MRTFPACFPLPGRKPPNVPEIQYGYIALQGRLTVGHTQSTAYTGRRAAQTPRLDGSAPWLRPYGQARRTPTPPSAPEKRPRIVLRKSRSDKPLPRCQQAAESPSGAAVCRNGAYSGAVQGREAALLKSSLPAATRTLSHRPCQVPTAEFPVRCPRPKAARSFAGTDAPKPRSAPKKHGASQRSPPFVPQATQDER